MQEPLIQDLLEVVPLLKYAKDLQEQDKLLLYPWLSECLIFKEAKIDWSTF